MEHLCATCGSYFDVQLISYDSSADTTGPPHTLFTTRAVLYCPYCGSQL